MKIFIKQNWFKLSLVIILLIIVISASIYFLTLPSKTSSDKSDFSLQANCAAQAKAFFEYYVPDLQERQNDEYSNHFNTKLNKCFVLITKPLSPGENSGYYLYLYDAVEKKGYGNYEWEYAAD